MLQKWLRTIIALCLVAMAGLSWAEDSFCRVWLRDVKLTEGELPKSTEDHTWRYWQRAESMRPYAVLDGEGEAYVGDIDASRTLPAPWRGAWPNPDQFFLFVRVPKAGDVAGRLYFPKADMTGMEALKFSIPAKYLQSGDANQDDARTPFYRAKEAYFNNLQRRNIPGGAWFRHESRSAQLALHQQPTENIQPSLTPAGGNLLWGGRIEDEFALFSGGRAVSENLQLERAMHNTKPEEETESLDDIQGVTVAEIDWKPLIKDLNPKLDPLASLIPADQHVVFFPSFAAAIETADQAELQGTPVLYLAEPRCEDALTSKRYQRQLGLSMTGLGRLLGPKVVTSVALTGSDPYYRTGTDVAVLFGAADPQMLETLLLAQVNLKAVKESDVKHEQGEIDGIKYSGIKTPDRRICSYIARLDNAVVVTNSLYQIERLAAVAKKKTPAIASLPEYVFFRDRYKLGDPEENALVFLSDATIRRWCGPRWRIATSRQVRDLAVLAELQAANMQRLMQKNVQPGPIYTDFATVDVGELSLNAQGVHSSVQGSLEFMTPLAELPMKKVTRAEKQAYEWWRNGYQQNWGWAFDPIALRLTLKQNRLAADMTVMPLIEATQYREMMAISKDAKFAPNAGDPHDALVQFILAINPKANSIRQAENMMSTMSQGVTLGWLGSNVSIYVDDDPVWQEIAKISQDQYFSELPKYVDRLPVAVRFDVSNGLRLTAFLAATRAFIEQTSPGMTLWESLTYKEQPYVKITPTERAKSETKQLEKAAVYYSASGKALLVTLNEDLMKRAIDRELERTAKEKEQKTAETDKTPGKDAAPVTENGWLGSNVALHVDRKALDLIGALSYDNRQAAMQILCWNNLPILNQWKRLYPDQDPVEVHERIWKIKLICPGGGKYVWNEKYQTMESTVYGHPGEPKTGPNASPLLDEFSSASFGLTFENQGLRAKVSLDKAKKK